MRPAQVHHDLLMQVRVKGRTLGECYSELLRNDRMATSVHRRAEHRAGRILHDAHGAAGPNNDSDYIEDRLS